MKTKHLILFILSAALAFGLGACKDNCVSTSDVDDTLTLMVYNVENLFDLDDTSLFGEYQQDPSHNLFPYSAAKLLTKINNHSSIIRMCNQGKGPDILALQELEVDFSQDPDFSLTSALERYAEQTVEELLGEDTLSPVIRKLPVEFFLIKRLAELGVKGYHFYEPKFDESWLERSIAHRCVYLSRYPSIAMQQHPLKDARDIFEVTFDVEGHPFTIFNNHWKSGASAPRSEPIRVMNATVMRGLLDERLANDPSADIVLVGDFNSHHNQALRMAGPVEMTGLNGILRSQSREAALLDGRADLYNLWYELPQPERGSEVWAGEWGTLMQIIVTPGLYDRDGIQYVDGSFNRMAIAGKNVSEEDGTPTAWVNMGSGAGYSDHLPVIAKFRFSRESGVNMPTYQMADLGNEMETQHLPIPVDFSLHGRQVDTHPEQLASLDSMGLSQKIGKLFLIEGEKMNRGVVVAGKQYGLYAPSADTRQWLGSKQDGEVIRFVGEFGVYREQLQFIIQDSSWIDPAL